MRTFYNSHWCGVDIDVQFAAALKENEILTESNKELLAKIERLYVLCKEASAILKTSRIFATTREKIKHPEGTDLYDQCISNLEALPPDTVTEGARLPRKSREELEAEYGMVLAFTPLYGEWGAWQKWHLRLADLAGQIAGRTE